MAAERISRVSITSRRSSGRSERGVSLVELLIGLAIGLLVTLAALGVIAFTRISSTTVSETVRLQQDATIAMRIIGTQLRQARAVAIQTTSVDAAEGAVGYRAYQGTTPPLGGSEVAVFGTEGGAGSDSITISTGVLNGVTTDCLGFEPAAPANTIVSTFDVNAGTLRCRGAGAFQPMLDNVEDLQFWYGMRNAATGNLQYLTANAVGSANWNAVSTVLVCVRLAGIAQTAPNLGAAGNPATVGCQNEAVAWDGRIRRVYRQVFTLRNAA